MSILAFIFMQWNILKLYSQKNLNKSWSSLGPVLWHFIILQVLIWEQLVYKIINLLHFLKTLTSNHPRHVKQTYS